METSRRLWVLAIVLGVGGCAGEEASAPPAAAPVTKVPAGPSAGGAPAVAAPAKDASSTKSPVAKGGEAKHDEAPPLEEPKTGAAKGVSLTDAEIAKIKTLPADEQDAALKQAVCPVSGDHLGNMGTPYKITAEGRTFYLCCDNCEPKVKQDPKGILAKLDKK